MLEKELEKIDVGYPDQKLIRSILKIFEDMWVIQSNFESQYQQRDFESLWFIQSIAFAGGTNRLEGVKHWIECGWEWGFIPIVAP